MTEKFKVLKSRVKFCVGDRFWGINDQELTARSLPTQVNILQCNYTSGISSEIIDFSTTFRWWSFKHSHRRYYPNTTKGGKKQKEHLFDS